MTEIEEEVAPLFHDPFLFPKVGTALSVLADEIGIGVAQHFASANSKAVRREVAQQRSRIVANLLGNLA